MRGLGTPKPLCSTESNADDLSLSLLHLQSPDTAPCANARTWDFSLTPHAEPSYPPHASAEVAPDCRVVAPSLQGVQSSWAPGDQLPLLQGTHAKPPGALAVPGGHVMCTAVEPPHRANQARKT